MPTDELQREYWEDAHWQRSYDHPVVSFFARQRVEHLRGAVDFGTIGNALDVGCGDGVSTYYMNEEIPDIVSVDRSLWMLKRHPVRERGKLAASDVRHLPFPDNSFDLVYAWEVLHHIPEPSGALAEMARVTRRYVLVAEPNRNNIFQFVFALVDSAHRWVLGYNLRYMRGLFERRGMKVLLARSGGWIFPNRTPTMLLPVVKGIPFWSAFGITNWVLAEKTV